MNDINQEDKDKNIPKLITKPIPKLISKYIPNTNNELIFHRGVIIEKKQKNKAIEKISPPNDVQLMFHLDLCD